MLKLLINEVDENEMQRINQFQLAKSERKVFGFRKINVVAHNEFAK